MPSKGDDLAAVLMTAALDHYANAVGKYTPKGVAHPTPGISLDIPGHFLVTFVTTEKVTGKYPVFSYDMNVTPDLKIGSVFEISGTVYVVADYESLGDREVTVILKALP